MTLPYTLKKYMEIKVDVNYQSMLSVNYIFIHH